jgi:hypothetical protein
VRFPDDPTVRDSAGIAWRYVQFYIPLWIIILYNLYVYIRVINFLRTNMPDLNSERLKYYPLVMAASWLVPSLLVAFGSDKQLKVFDYMDRISIGTFGFLNAVVYGFTPVVRAELRRKFCTARIVDAEMDTEVSNFSRLDDNE